MVLSNFSSPSSGKQTPALKSSVGASAASNKCLSLATRQGQHLELEAETVEAVSAWLYGIQTVLSKAGKACYVDTDTANRPVQSAASASRAKRFSVMGATLDGVEASRHANFKRTILSIPREETLRLLTAGSEFWLYAPDTSSPSSSATVTRTLVHLFYVPNTSAICWSEPGTRKVDVKRSISIHAIRDLYVGKMSATLKLPIAAAAEKSRCLTIATATAEVNLEGRSVESVTALLSGINHLLNSNGMQVLIDDNTAGTGSGSGAGAGAGSVAVPAGSRRYSILPYSKPALLPRTAQETMISVAQGAPTLAAVNVRDTVNMMSQGRRFVRYVLNADGSLAKQVISLFYSKSQNALYYCAPGERVMDDAHCIRLANLRKVLLGKQSATLRHADLAPLQNTKCVCIVDSAQNELNISAETPELLSAFLYGLQNLVATKSGKNGPQLLPAPSPSPATLPCAAHTGRLFLTFSLPVRPLVFVAAVVVDTPAQHEQRMAASAVAAALPRTAAETVKQLAARRATLIGLSDSATIDLMRAGSRFHRWSLRGVVAEREAVTVFFSGAAFWWCSPVGPKREIAGQSVPLASLTDVFLSVPHSWLRAHASNRGARAVVGGDAVQRA